MLSRRQFGIRLGMHRSILATIYTKYFLPSVLKKVMTTNAASSPPSRAPVSGQLATVEVLILFFQYFNIDIGV